MKTYRVLFAEDVPHYGVAEITADSDAAVLDAAKAYKISEVTNDAEWENSSCKRIVWIEDPDGNTVAEGVALDDCHLRYGGEKERLLCDAAPRLLKVLMECETELSGVIEMMRYEGDLAVTALDGSQIQRAYDALRNVAIDLREAINAAREQQQ
jgi:hypothetical protein